MLSEEYIREKLEKLKEHRSNHYIWLINACRNGTPLQHNLQPVLQSDFYMLIQDDGFPKPEVAQYVTENIQD